MVKGEGRLEAGPSVRVGDDVYRGTDVVLATGSYSRTLPGLEIGGRIIASEQALELDEIPERVIVLGGGVIGVEFASVWKSFGADVTIVEALDHLVPNEDIALSKALERAFRRRGIAYSLGVRFQSATQTSDAVTVTLEDGKTLRGGLPPRRRRDAAPPRPDSATRRRASRIDRGFVITDERLRTGVDHVWAVGDIVPGLQLAHRGFQQGIFVAEEIAGLKPVVIPDTHIPKVTYCSPEVASVGLTEAQAVSAHGADGVVAYEYNLAGNGKSEILGTSGIVKVVRAKDGPVLGVHMVGDRVGELISEGQLVVGLGSAPRRHRAVRARPPHAERSTGRGIPRSGGQTAARALTPGREAHH